jgi:hypothetical protein
LDNNSNNDSVAFRIPATDIDCFKSSTELILKSKGIHPLSKNIILVARSAEDTAWNSQNFTKLEAYDSTKPFQFIVHKLTAFDGNWSKKMLGFDVPVDLISNPQAISSAKVLSASVISESKRTTYGGSVGLILKIPQKNIVATRPADMQSMIPLGKALADSQESFERTLVKFHEFYGIENPRELLDHTTAALYNEVVAVGTGAGGEKVEVIGIALFEMNGYLPLYPGVEAKLLESAHNNNLQVIRIPMTTKMNLSEYAGFEEQNQDFQKFLVDP